MHHSNVQIQDMIMENVLSIYFTIYYVSWTFFSQKNTTTKNHKLERIYYIFLTVSIKTSILKGLSFVLCGSITEEYLPKCLKNCTRKKSN